MQAVEVYQDTDGQWRIRGRKPDGVIRKVQRGYPNPDEAWAAAFVEFPGEQPILVPPELIGGL